MSFVDLVRLQQARFRASLGDAAQNPVDAVGCRHGHLLALGHEDENLMPELRGPGGATELFRARGIKWWKNVRSGDSRSEGPTRNLLSSQVACVNFLLPLARAPAALTTLLRALDDDVEAIVPITDRDGNTSLVEFEWVGRDAPLEGGPITRGANQTSVDAMIVGRTPTGNRAYLFEWKLTEQYLDPEDKGMGQPGQVRRTRYLDRYLAPTSPFRGDVPLDEFLVEPFYQIMRLHLLAAQILAEGVAPGLPVANARVLVFCPAGNLEYRNAVASTPLARRHRGFATVEDVTRATMKNPAMFAVVATEHMVAWIRARGHAPSSWLEYHHQRYGW